MKKIIAYIGSRKGEYSNTYQFTEKILNECKKKNQDIEFEVISAKDMMIKSCLGCEHCFTHGKCPLDKVDEIGQLKEKFLSADMVIFASPVYAHNVSGDMKIVVDRISHWLHNMKLNRKHAGIISTTDSNGHLTVLRYLEKLMYLLGVNIVFKINCALTHPHEFHDNEWMLQKTDELSDKIITALFKPIISNNILEGTFQVMKDRYNGMKKEKNIIGNFTEAVEIELFENATYQDFLDKHQ